MRIPRAPPSARRALCVGLACIEVEARKCNGSVEAPPHVSEEHAAMTYDKSAQAQDKAARRSAADREGFRRRTVSARLKPFDWSDPNLGIRRADVDVFKAAARAFDHIILVRATNPASLGYIGDKNFYPKPMDCKPKTADNDVSIPFASRRIHSKTAGLVVDPTLVGPNAFKDGKYDKAMDSWRSFLKDKTRSEIANKVYRRRGTGFGCFAVDTDMASPYFGCLMISRSGEIERSELDGRTIATAEGEKGFDEAARQATAKWRNAEVRDKSTGEYRRRMQYLHGDYDLYALIDSDRPDDPTVKEWVNGRENWCSKRFPEIQEFVNRGIGAPMIQHGDQFRLAHQGDRIYTFYPLGSAYFISESEAASIAELFEIAYGIP